MLCYGSFGVVWVALCGWRWLGSTELGTYGAPFLNDTVLLYVYVYGQYFSSKSGPTPQEKQSLISLFPYIRSKHMKGIIGKLNYKIWHRCMAEVVQVQLPP